jgi:hypothetical protein
VILVDGITRALFLNRYANPSELLGMTFRELTYFYEVAKNRPTPVGGDA